MKKNYINQSMKKINYNMKKNINCTQKIETVGYIIKITLIKNNSMKIIYNLQQIFIRTSKNF